MFIKICGIRNLEEAVAAAKAGADAIGIMQVAESPRYLSIGEAQQLSRAIKEEETASELKIVAVVANEEQGIIQNIINKLSPDMLQFHGDEKEDFCQDFGKDYIKSIKAIDQDSIRLSADNHSKAKYLLLDSFAANLDSYGGSGTKFNWEVIPLELLDRIILAGGLDADNVGELISKYQVSGVDVSSGVEKKRGIKDIDKIYQFVEAVHQSVHQAQST